MQKTTEVSDINTALQAFFVFVDNRLMTSAPLPIAINRAFETIVAYYTPRLRQVLQFTICNRLYSNEALYNYGWTQLWRCGHQITSNRTPAGVYKWLARTLHHRQLQLWKICSREARLMTYLDDWLNGRHVRQGGANVASAPTLLQAPQLGLADDAQYRFKLLYAYFEKALASLGERQQHIIKLSKLSDVIRHYQNVFHLHEVPFASCCKFQLEYSLEEIKIIMRFSSLEAAKSFKRRAFRALVKKMLRLFKRDLQNRNDLIQKEIVEEWLERFGQVEVSRG